MVFWCTLYWHSFFFSQWKFMLMMRPSWLHGLVQVSLMLFFFFFFNFCNIFVSLVDCLLLIQLMHIFIVSLCSAIFYWRRQRKTANWMTLMHWTSIRLSFLSRVWLELLSWTSYLLSVTKAAELNKLLCSWFLLLFFIFLLYGEKLRWLSFLLCQVKINRQNRVIFSTQRWYKHAFYFSFVPLFVPYRP